jgi:hypothetical protein
LGGGLSEFPILTTAVTGKCLDLQRKLVEQKGFEPVTLRKKPK